MTVEFNTARLQELTLPLKTNRLRGSVMVVNIFLLVTIQLYCRLEYGRALPFAQSPLNH